jgi:hypothetical protein
MLISNLVRTGHGIYCMLILTQCHRMLYRTIAEASNCELSSARQICVRRLNVKVAIAFRFTNHRLALVGTPTSHSLLVGGSKPEGSAKPTRSENH